jgi:hypothetical protein
MLKTLYQTLKESEARILELSKELKGSGTDCSSPNRQVWDFPVEETYTYLYSASSWTRNKELRIFGPVGERPLHVCALSVNRFNDIDFEKHGNYVAGGILDGLKKFIAGDTDSENWDEAYVQYGKDYCAAVGAYLSQPQLEDSESDSESLPELRLKNDKWRTANDMSQVGQCAIRNAEDRLEEPPFWQALIKWHSEHSKLNSKSSSFKQTDNDKHKDNKKPTTMQKDNKILTTIGLYEGETILYPMVAGDEGDFLYWLFKNEKPNHARPSRCRR